MDAETPTGRAIRLIQEEARAPLLAEIKRLRQFATYISVRVDLPDDIRRHAAHALEQQLQLDGEKQ
jgi:hypothetical protein